MRGVTVDGTPVDRIVYARLATDRPVDEPGSFRALLNSFLPRKRAISQMLVRDTKQRVLLCQLTYKTDWEKRASAIARGMFSGAASDNDKSVDAALELVLSQNPGMMQAMWASMMKTDERATIPQLRIPWLICYGMHSQIYPRQVRKWMLERAPQARALGFSASGHSPHLEEPATFAQALVRFADGLPTATSSSQALGRAM